MRESSPVGCRPRQPSATAEVRRAHEHFPSLWSAPQAPAERVHQDAARLDAAAVCEWGATLSGIIELFGALEELADGAPATVLALDDATARLAAMLRWERGKVATVIRHFALTPRAELLRTEPPFDASDVYSWRYGRRLLAVRRPLILRQGASGDELVYGFRAVHNTGRQLVHEIASARLKVETAAMRRAMTALGQRRDLEFNTHVADLYRGVPGMIVREQVDRIGNSRIARANGDALGDVDVLAADRTRLVLHAVEAKNLAVGRTPLEIARELRRTFKTHGSKTAAIDKHAERTAWLEQHLADVLGWLGLNPGQASRWHVEPSIVVDTEVTAPFLEQLSMPVYDAAMLAGQLARRARGTGDGTQAAA
jgi:hypothetical protein